MIPYLAIEMDNGRFPYHTVNLSNRLMTLKKDIAVSFVKKLDGNLGQSDDKEGDETEILYQSLMRQLLSSSQKDLSRSSCLRTPQTPWILQTFHMKCWHCQKICRNCLRDLGLQSVTNRQTSKI